jgi:hypothetical protein
VSSKAVQVRLWDRRKGSAVDAILHIGLTEDQIRDTQSKWEPLRKAAIRGLLNEGMSIDRLPKHWGWDWTRKISRLNHPLLGFFAIEADGEIQGLMEVAKEGHRAQLPGEDGKPLIYVKYIEVAPWNSKLLDPEPTYGGVGSRLIRAAIELSIQEDCKGRIGLHSLPGSNEGEPEWFYKSHCRMEPIESERNDEGLLYFEMSPERADEFLGGKK